MGIKLASTSGLGALGLGLALPFAAQAITTAPAHVIAQGTPLTPEILAKSQLGAQWLAAFAL